MPKTAASTEHSTTSSPVCLTFNDFRSHLTQEIRQLLDEECLLDVTIAVGGERFRAHRLVLIASSKLLAGILSQVNDEMVTIILSEDIDPKDVKSILEFIYTGQTRTMVDDLQEFMAAVQALGITSLMELGTIIQEEEEENKPPESCEDSQVFEEYNDDDDDDMGKLAFDSSNEVKNEARNDSINEDSSDAVKRQRRRSVCKKEYTDEMLSNAINDIKAGNSLLDAAAKFHIPRSTLYMRAKVLGIPLTHHKCDYTAEDMKAAINAVIAGSSLQNAADNFGIPKTVLWRRIQKEGHVYRTDSRRNYDTEKREAAIKALQRGEALTKVAQEYQIPKTTLFRDKVRLVDEGKLPESDWRKRKSYVDGEKRAMLEKAVAACKKGTMSQATAAMTFNIPKTTIWRRLQRDALKGLEEFEVKRSSRKGQYRLRKDEEAKSEEVGESNFEVYCDEDSDLGITYISEDPNMSDDSNVIVLAHGTANDLNLHGNQYIIVQDGSEENFASCGLELDENTAFDTKS